MLKKTISFIDYNGNQRTEDFYFNLSKAELAEMELTVDGGLTAMCHRIASTQDIPTIFNTFKSIVLRSYGEKSPDGKRFIKSAELSTAFSQTEAYSQLIMEMIQNPDVAIEFVKGIAPFDAKEAAQPVLMPAT